HRRARVRGRRRTAHSPRGARMERDDGRPRRRHARMVAPATPRTQLTPVMPTVFALTDLSAAVHLALLVLACGLATYVWRGLGVLLSGRFSADGEFFTWAGCVA